LRKRIDIIEYGLTKTIIHNIQIHFLNHSKNKTMIKKSINRLVGLKKESFDQFRKTGQIQLQPARLIPALRTGDEMALTSIFLSGLKLVKEFRDIFFKEIGLSRRGKFYFFTEAKFNDISSAKLDGLIIVVVSGKIVDAVFLEMKNANNFLDSQQLERYIDISKKLRVDKFVTVSNEFVTDSNCSPVTVKNTRSVTLSHFSWTYLITKAQLLLFKNNTNIDDRDQVEIMKEILFYFEHNKSGIKGYSKMKPGWKKLAENITGQRSLALRDKYIEEAVLSWHELEKALALLLSRKLGVIVEPVRKSSNRLKNDIVKVVENQYLEGAISAQGAVSNIKIKMEFERRTVSMSISVTPPQDRRNSSRVTWVNNQLKRCKEKSSHLFAKYADEIWLESDITYKKEHHRIKLGELTSFSESARNLNDIKNFNIILIKRLGSNFASRARVVAILENMIVEYYQCIVENFTSWKKPAPKIVQDKTKIEEPLNNNLTKNIIVPPIIPLDQQSSSLEVPRPPSI